jgi:hypothetical protein
MGRPSLRDIAKASNGEHAVMQTSLLEQLLAETRRTNALLESLVSDEAARRARGTGPQAVTGNH